VHLLCVELIRQSDYGGIMLGNLLNNKRTFKMVYVLFDSWDMHTWKVHLFLQHLELFFFCQLPFLTLSPTHMYIAESATEIAK